MKHTHIYIVLILCVAFLASCQKEDPAQGLQEKVTIEYQLSQDVLCTVKSAGDASQINVIWYGVYHKKQLADGSHTYIYKSDMSDFVEIPAGSDLSKISVPITLIKNQEYKLVFVAQHRFMQANETNYTYIYNIRYQSDPSGPDSSPQDQAIMYLNETDKIAEKIQDGECMDVFVAVDPVGPITGNENRNKKLTRPVAQINLGSSEVVAAAAPVTLSGIPASYNLLEGTYSQETISHTFKNLSPIDPEGTCSLTVGGSSYRHLTTLYVLGGNNISITTSNTTVGNIATAPNYKTNIVGKIIF